jgi:carbon monoxide dehydrogenase subunit G
MAFQSSGEFTVDLDRESVFGVIGDPVRVAQCIPGCTDLSELSPGRYSAVLTNEVAFITLRFKVIVEVVKTEPPVTIEAKVTGQTIGLAGRVTANAGLHLSEAGPKRTEVRYSSNVALAGKLGGLGEPVFRAKSAEVSRQFGANLKAAIETFRADHHEVV